MAEPCPVAEVDPGWLTQPVATLGAAGIAVIAALIAYLGVLKSTSMTRRENRRAEKVAVLSEGMTAVQNYARAIMQIARTDAEHRPQLIALLSSDRINDINEAAALTLGKLSLFDFRDATKKTTALVAVLVFVWDAVRADPSIPLDADHIEPYYKEATEALREAFARLK